MESKQRLLEPQLVQTGRADQFSRKVFCDGMRDGVPIALGYFAVSFSLGIAARKAGFTPFQGFLVSLLNNASAGEYAAFALIMANATYFEVAVITLIANARYLLMSCALAQRFAPETPFWHRLLIGYDVTDELFGITIARPGNLNPYYTYGAILLAAPAWACGTALGIIAGNLLPLRVVSALSVALYGMFLAIIIPPARKNRIVAALVVISLLGPGKTRNVILALGLVFIPSFARMARGTYAGLREVNYVKSARLMGASSGRILWRHILPNILSPIIVQMTFTFATAIISEASLSFLGAGIPSPYPSWGGMLNEARGYVYMGWWMIVFPAIFTALSVLGFNLFGDGLRDLIDPLSGR